MWNATMIGAPIALYQLAAEIVPVLMVALFLDRRRVASRVGRRASLGARIQRDLYLMLCVGAFVVALLVVARVLPGTDLTAAVVIAALVGCVALLAAQARRGGAGDREQGAPDAHP